MRNPNGTWVPPGLTGLAPVPQTNVTDPKTKIQTMLREDSTMAVTYPDGTVNTIFGDGTCMHRYCDGKILIEAEGYAPMEILESGVTTYLADGSVLQINNKDVKFVRPDGIEMGLKSDKTAHLKTSSNGGLQYIDVTKGKIWNKSKEGHYFELNQTGVDVQLQPGAEATAVETLVTPRLFLINNKNEGHELLNPAQLKQFTQFFGEANYKNDSNFDKPD